MLRPALLVLVFTLTSSAQTAPKIIERAIEYLGGPKSIEAAQKSRIVLIGTRDLTAGYQGRRPDRPTAPRWSETLVMDYPRHRAALRTESSNSDGTPTIWMSAITGDTGYRINLKTNRVIPAKGAALDEEWEAALWHIPHLALSELIKHPDRLKVEPREENIDVVSYAIPDRATMILRFDRTSGALVGYYFSGDYVLGTTRVTVDYKPYIESKTLGRFPSGLRLTIGDMVYRDLDLFDARHSDTTEEPWLQPLKEEAKPVSRIASQPPAKFEQVAPHAFVLRNVGGYNTMLVEIDSDCLAVVDAPSNIRLATMVPPAKYVDDLGRQIIDASAKQFPNRRICYVIPTHHHSDHFNGIRTLAVSGSTVITTAGNEKLARQVLAAGNGAARVEIIRGSRTLGSGETQLHIFELPGNQHVDELLFAYLPSSGVVFEGDVGDYVLAAKSFLKFAEEHNLKVTRLYGVHNSSSATLDEYETDYPAN